jgi:hypothetical protein
MSKNVTFHVVFKFLKKCERAFAMCTVILQRERPIMEFVIFLKPKHIHLVRMI